MAPTTILALRALFKLAEKKGIPMNQDEQVEKMNLIIARCWTDEGFKRQLLSDPENALKAEGINVPVGTDVRVVENDDRLLHLVLPARPTELSDAELDGVAGGGQLIDRYRRLSALYPGDPVGSFIGALFKRKGSQK